MSIICTPSVSMSIEGLSFEARQPRGPNEFPFLFHSLPGICRGGVGDVGVVGCLFVGDCVRQDAGEVVVFVNTEDVGE